MCEQNLVPPELPPHDLQQESPSHQSASCSDHDTNLLSSSCASSCSSTDDGGASSPPPVDPTLNFSMPEKRPQKRRHCKPRVRQAETVHRIVEELRPVQGRDLTERLKELDPNVRAVAMKQRDREKDRQRKQVSRERWESLALMAATLVDNAESADAFGPLAARLLTDSTFNKTEIWKRVGKFYPVQFGLLVPHLPPKIAAFHVPA